MSDRQLTGSPAPNYTSEAIEIAIQAGNIESLETFFKRTPADIIDFKNEEGYTAFELAIHAEQLKVVKFLLLKSQNSTCFSIDLHKAAAIAVVGQQTSILEEILNHEKSIIEGSVPRDVVLTLQDEERSPQSAILNIDRTEPCINKPYPEYTQYAGDCLLHLAIKANHDTPIVELLLRRGADFNCKNSQGFTPLHIAAQYLKVNLVKLLLKQRGIKIVSRNNDKYTPLELAFMSGQEESTLTEATRDAFLYLKNSPGNTNDIQARSNSIIDLLIKNASRSDKQYFLYRAASDGLLEIVKLLIKNPEIEINAPHRDGWTMLHIAVSHKDNKIVEALLNKNADFTILNNKKASPFKLALQANMTDIIDLFANSVSRQEQNEEFITRFTNHLKENFISALQLGDKKIIEILLKQYSKYISIHANADRRYFSWTPLHFAANYGHIELVESFLQQGADTTSVDSMGRTPLHLAVECSKSPSTRNSIIKALLDRPLALFDAAHNFQDKISDLPREKSELLNERSKLLDERSKLLDKTYGDDKKTALTLALKTQEPEVIKFLLEYKPKLDLGVTLRWAATGQRKNTIGVIEYLLTNFEFKTTELTSTLRQTLLNAKVEEKRLIPIIKLLLEKGAQLNTPDERTGKTPLIIAVEQGKEASVELFLEHEDIQVNTADHSSLSALNHAAYNKNLGILDKLVKYYHSRNCLYSQINNPLLSAIAAHQKEAVELLLPYFKDHTAYHEELGSAFAWAAECDHLDIIKKIVDYGFDINTQLNFKRKKAVSALNIAAEKGRTQTVKFLLSKQAKSDMLDRYGWAPLHLAIKAGHEDTALALISLDPVIHLQGGPEEDAPIHLAAEYGLGRVVDKLIDKHVNTDIKNLRGETPLHFAIANGFESIAIALINAGADIHSRVDGRMMDTNGAMVDCENFSALHLAAQSNSLKVAEQLLNAGIDANIKTFNGITPLHSSANTPHERKISVLPMLKLLVDYGAKIDSEAFEGQTPLHLSAEFGDIEMAKYLIAEYTKRKERGDHIKDIVNMSTYSGNKIGHTPIHIAIYYRHTILVKYLLEHGIDMAKNHQGWIALELAVSGKVQPKKSSEIYFPETPLSPKKYPALFHSSNGAKKEDSVEIAILKPLFAQYLKCFPLSNEEKSDLLTAATQHKQAEIVDFLLKQDDFSPNYKNSNGEYPIQMSAIVGSTEIMGLLVDKGAKINLKGSKTPVSYASHYNQEEIVEWLVSHDADLTLIDPNEYSRNPIHFAVIGDSKESLKILLAHAEKKGIAKKLIDSQDSLGLTPLQLAIIYEQDTEVIMSLVNYGADINKIAHLLTKESSESSWSAMNFALYLENGANDAIAKLLFGIRALPAEDTADPKQWTTFTKILIESTDVLKQKTSSPVIHAIASQYINCIFEILNNAQVTKELGSINFKSVVKILETISRQTSHYMAGKPIDNLDNLVETPDLSLRMLKTPGSGVDPRTGYIVSPPRQQAEEMQERHNIVTSASRMHHYARFR